MTTKGSVAPLSTSVPPTALPPRVMAWLPPSRIKVTIWLASSAALTPSANSYPKSAAVGPAAVGT